MLLTRAIFLITTFVGVSFAATTVDPAQIFSEPIKEIKGPILQNPTAEAVDLSSEVLKEFPSKPGSIEKQRTIQTSNLHDNEVTGPKDKQEHITDVIAVRNLQDNTRQVGESSNELGHASTTTIKKQGDSEFNGLRTREGHFPNAESSVVTAIDGTNGSETTGKKVDQTLKNGNLTTAELDKKLNNVKHTNVQRKHAYHPDSQHRTEAETKYDSLSTNKETEHSDIMQRNLRLPFSDIQVTDFFNTKDTEDALTSFGDMNIVSDTPERRLELTRHTKTEDNKKLKHEQEKTVITRKTPLSLLKVEDATDRQTKDSNLEQVSKVTRKTDDKKGSTTTTNEETRNTVNERIEQHDGDFNYEKSPLKGSASLGLKVKLSSHTIDNDVFNSDKQVKKTVDSVTPDSKKTSVYNEDTKREYSFQSIPSPKDQTPDTNGECDETPIAQANNGVSGFAVGVTKRGCEPKLQTQTQQPVQPQVSGETKPVQPQTSEIKEPDNEFKREEFKPTEPQGPQLENTQSIVISPAGTNEDKKESETTQQQQPQGTVPSKAEGEPTPTQTTPVENNASTGTQEKQDSGEHITAEDIKANFGTMVLIVPGLQADGHDTIQDFKDTVITQKYLDLINFARTNKLASRVMLVGADNVEGDQIDKFLYHYSKTHPVHVLDIMPFTKDADLYELISREDSESSSSSSESTSDEKPAATINPSSTAPQQ